MTPAFFTRRWMGSPLQVPAQRIPRGPSRLEDLVDVFDLVITDVASAHNELLQILAAIFLMFGAVIT